jgi:myo-inositol 2-dehydrogenase/D-chiro-inositol 1-dehydrogenase
MAPLGIALIGAGRIGQLHARNIVRNPRARLLCVFEQDKERAKGVAEMAGCHIASVFEEAIDFPGVEAIYICSPTDTHFDFVLSSVDAGKYVFCEKPIDLDLARASSCVRRLGKRADQVMMGFNRRFDPSQRALRQAVLAGEAGSIEQIVIISRDPTPPTRSYLSQSGGIFRDMTIHDFDTARSLAGFEFANVFASGSALFSEEIRSLSDYDTVTAVLSGPNGETCTVINSRHCPYGFEQRIEIFGSKGKVALENPRPIELSTFTNTGETRSRLYDFFPERYASAYERLLEEFVTRARSNEPFSVTIVDGLWSLVLAEAAQRSAQTGTLVSVPEGAFLSSNQTP